MNNNNNTKKNLSDFAEWLNSISPLEYVTVGTVIAYLISWELDANSQNSLGNWLEMVGQIMLTFSAQASATPTQEEYQQLLNDVENLKKELNNLKNKNN